LENSARESTDFLTPEQRSERMRRVRAKDTKLELTVRRLVHAMGFRYRLHSRTLPGHPDLVFAGRRKVIFVHGCFWHLHESCRQYRLPRNRQEFWIPKLEETRRRDSDNQRKLRELGWSVLIVWECGVKHRDELVLNIRDFLEGVA
jgi:DNA mismatch endonuclease, patch repair protein